MAVAERGDAGKRVASPCVRNCCLDDNDVCLGCFRTIKEICAWSEASDDERTATLERCAERKARKDTRAATGFRPPPE